MASLKEPSVPVPKRRSRTGCWSCKARKVKWCDYSIRLNWERGSRKTPSNHGFSRKVDSFSFKDLSENASRGPSPPLVLPDRDAPGHAVAVAKHTTVAGLCHAHSGPGLRRNPDPNSSNTRKLQDISSISPSTELPPPFSPGLNITPPHFPQRAPLPNGVGNVKQISQSIGPLPSSTESQSPHSHLSYQSKSWPKPSPDLSLTKGGEITPSEDSASSGVEPHPHALQTRLSWPRSPALGVTSDCLAKYQGPNQKNWAMDRRPCSLPTSPSGISEHKGWGYMAPWNTNPPSPASDPGTTSTAHTTRKLEARITNTLVDTPIYSSPFSLSVAMEIDTETPVDNPAIAPVHPLTSPHKNLIDYDVIPGSPDEDIGKNNDHRATEKDSLLRRLRSQSRKNYRSNSAGLDRNIQRKAVTTFLSHHYYTPCVPKTISRYSSSVPSTLLESAVNLLYFHHFINHTGRSLTRHDCPDNPFIHVLPAMAVEDPNLMNLLLVLSAGHRARLLGHLEPSSRIDQWTRPVLPALRAALANPEKHRSFTNLATVLMLITIKLMFPDIFEVPLSWQAHLKFARELFISHQPMHHGSERDTQQDAVEKFLSQWLGYIDIIGSHYCQQTELALFEGGYLQQLVPADRDKELELDCFSGFTPICGSLFRRLSELTHQCDKERRRYSYSPGGSSEWRPTTEIIDKAEKLRQDMINMSTPRYKYWRHRTAQEWKRRVATNRAFQLAGLIHLYRRVMGRESSDPEVQSTVAALTNELNQIPRNEKFRRVCPIPQELFTAGPAQCEEFRAQMKTCE
ncbi:hypothetical protein AJ78_05649 [Emergomyces pasteurianus Ep9510]|uniref:Zn(2)-C6 fungal-type domain-containing protein n=1 Tax=Emergomyces pasteurianus Ep9510 TaxID=1447872 RepID=A0A1J9PD82_9EURO|nr:hypothetical protein AJ78_05649 [Emergomyces pasteurianus Ep9510]